MTTQQAVEQFISDNFESSVITVTDFPLFPHGKKVTDKNGSEMVVYWDCWTETVKWAFPD